MTSLYHPPLKHPRRANLISLVAGTATLCILAIPRGTRGRYRSIISWCTSLEDEGRRKLGLLWPPPSSGAIIIHVDTEDVTFEDEDVVVGGGGGGGAAAGGEEGGRTGEYNPTTTIRKQDGDNEERLSEPRNEGGRKDEGCDKENDGNNAGEGKEGKTSDEEIWNFYGLFFFFSFFCQGTGERGGATSKRTLLSFFLSLSSSIL